MPVLALQYRLFVCVAIWVRLSDQSFVDPSNELSHCGMNKVGYLTATPKTVTYMFTYHCYNNVGLSLAFLETNSIQVRKKRTKKN